MDSTYDATGKRIVANTSKTRPDMQRQGINTSLFGSARRAGLAVEEASTQSALEGSLTDLGKLAQAGRRAAAEDASAPTLYYNLARHVMKYMEEESVAAGLPQFDWLSSEVSSQLPRLIDDFFESVGITSKAKQNVLREYFSTQRVRDYQSLAPEEAATMRRQVKEAQDDILLAELNGDTPNLLDELAETKGFDVEYDPAVGVVVRDKHSSLEMPFDDKDAALKFVRDFDREMPDITPMSDIPLEVMEAAPGGQHAGSTIQRTVSVEQEISIGEDILEKTAKEQAKRQAIGGGAPPPPPITPPPPSGTPPLPPPPGTPPVPEPSMSKQFRDLASSNGQRYQKLLDDLTSQVAHAFLPMRNWTLRAEQLMTEAGVTSGRLWESYRNTVTGITKAHNESDPYYKEINSIIRSFRRQHVRKGHVSEVLEAPTVARRTELMDKHEFTADERIAVDRAIGFSSRSFLKLALTQPEKSLIIFRTSLIGSDVVQGILSVTLRNCQKKFSFLQSILEMVTWIYVRWTLVSL